MIGGLDRQQRLELLKSGLPSAACERNFFSLSCIYNFCSIPSSGRNAGSRRIRISRMSNNRDRLAQYPVVVETPVAWGEMDAFGHVNNIIYFRYFESARIAYFEKLDMPEFIGRDPIGPILAETTCRFRAPLSYPDTVSIGARVASVGEDRFMMNYVVFSHKLERIAAEGEGIMVCYDYRQNRKASVPPGLRQRIEEIERGVSNRPAS